MKSDPAESIEVSLTGWAYGGEALGRTNEGRMIFAPFCIPGESVRGAPIEERPSWARILPREWLHESAERIAARCPHFTKCGGCHYQHVSYDQQLELKRSIVTEQLQRIGGLANPPVGRTVPSPKAWEYRNHMRYHVLADGSLGLMRFKEPTPLAIEVCFLPEPALQDIWARIDLPGESAVDQVALRQGTSGDVMVILHGDMQHINELAIDFPVSIVWQDGDSWRVLAGDSAIQFEIMDLSFRVSAPSFFQVNTSILPDLVQQVMSAIDVEPGMTFIDLYAGVGLFSAFAAKQGAHVFAVEESGSACADFEVNLEHFREISLYESPVELGLPAIKASPDVILVDPPRAGLSRKALDALSAMTAERIVYLSCDVGTLARDAKRLEKAGYQLDQVSPIDLFPQTFHIETLSTWSHH